MNLLAEFAAFRGIVLANDLADLFFVLADAARTPVGRAQSRRVCELAVELAGRAAAISSIASIALDGNRTTRLSLDK